MVLAPMVTVTGTSIAGAVMNARQPRRSSSAHRSCAGAAEASAEASTSGRRVRSTRPMTRANSSDPYPVWATTRVPQPRPRSTASSRRCQASSTIAAAWGRAMRRPYGLTGFGTLPEPRDTDLTTSGAGEHRPELVDEPLARGAEAVELEQPVTPAGQQHRAATDVEVSGDGEVLDRQLVRAGRGGE